MSALEPHGMVFVSTSGGSPAQLPTASLELQAATHVAGAQTSGQINDLHHTLPASSIPINLRTGDANLTVRHDTHLASSGGLVQGSNGHGIVSGDPTGAAAASLSLSSHSSNSGNGAWHTFFISTLFSLNFAALSSHVQQIMWSLDTRISLILIMGTYFCFEFMAGALSNTRRVRLRIHGGCAIEYMAGALSNTQIMK
ncbi:hypothetical protein SCHPADRAFT_681042 [Schizopora paradoxa]|uniref:Uncharacterized protein n=1 Tax=Schizopora paradoxa TaxID=27342 RepID=A0A0H2RPH3_9AGAM|nr:hypothetical protein SCHPADRAFT_681042 [Schizopora paradoxa]